MKIQNMANKENFIKAYDDGLFEIELMKKEETGKKVYRFSDNRLNTVSWILHKYENKCAIEYNGDVPFTVYCSMDNNNIEIDHAIMNGKTYRADRYLKKFEVVCILTNCFTNFGLCD